VWPIRGPRLSHGLLWSGRASERQIGQSEPLPRLGLLVHFVFDGDLVGGAGEGVVTWRSPWLPFAAEINCCLELGARGTAGTACPRTLVRRRDDPHALLWQWARRLPTMTDSDSHG
jgi:hypothetical protein